MILTSPITYYRTVLFPVIIRRQKLFQQIDDGEKIQKMNTLQVWGKLPHLSQTVRKALNTPEHQFADL